MNRNTPKDGLYNEIYDTQNHVHPGSMAVARAVLRGLLQYKYAVLQLPRDYCYTNKTVVKTVVKRASLY